MKEIWKDITGYEGKYQVSNCGRIRGLTRNDSRGRKRIGREMKPHVMKLGYLQIHLSKNGVSDLILVHKLVMHAFVGPCPDGLECNHIDGNKSNNRIDNLEYCTRSQNLLHAFRVLGIRSTWGEDYWNSKLTYKKVERIRKLHATGKYTYKRLSEMYNVLPVTIMKAIKKITWRHL